MDGPASQASLARQTGLSAAAVHSIVHGLRAAGVVELRRVNGRETIVSLVAATGVLLVLEVGEHRIDGAAFNLTRREVSAQTIQGGRNDPEAAAELALSLAGGVGADVSSVAGVAVAMTAPVERATGAIVPWCNSRMPGWAGVGIRETLEHALGVGVLVDNDANFAALAEWTWGVGRGVDDLLYVRGSAGIGGGIIIDGTIYHGGNGLAGAMGHVTLDNTGQVCYCGSRGCLTSFISERAIIDAVRTSPGAKHGISDVIIAARSGDAACQRVLTEAGGYLGVALANVAKIIAPSVIAIGGELGAAGSLVFDGILASLELSNVASAATPPRLVAGRFGSDVARLGAVAALLAESGRGISELEDWMTEDRVVAADA